ncbi:hypothetical protein Nm8I071_42760 [Nonomuraea sp. TT08I-71]|nr:hypothetical protein Nm8I071_42760 [Nonomuraea sp. TT08I-71]
MRLAFRAGWDRQPEPAVEVQGASHVGDDQTDEIELRCHAATVGADGPARLERIGRGTSDRCGPHGWERERTVWDKSGLEQ